MLALAPVVAGLLLGWLTGGQLRAIAAARFRRGWVLLLGAAAGGCHSHWDAARHATERIHVPLLALSYLALAAWGVLNLAHVPPHMSRSVAMVGTGAMLNAAVITVNGRMPVATSVLGQPARDFAQLSDKHEQMTPSTGLPWLGDVMPMAGGHLMVSLGDILLVFGCVMLLSAMMRRPSAARHRREKHGGRTP
ncbi:DUF5317 family protein [Kitasatospora sp. NPDC059571]|uniref:DUF5317 family protein n=1 Tax=Kitasatospora sp. NPDC059571 TaxID=3346871 RepID=UPI0036C125FA